MATSKKEKLWGAELLGEPRQDRKKLQIWRKRKEMKWTVETLRTYFWKLDLFKFLPLCTCRKSMNFVVLRPVIYVKTYVSDINKHKNGRSSNRGDTVCCGWGSEMYNLSVYLWFIIVNLGQLFYYCSELSSEWCIVHSTKIGVQCDKRSNWNNNWRK